MGDGALREGNLRYGIVLHHRARENFSLALCITC